LQHRKKRESESHKNRCKKIVMMKLVIQKKINNKNHWIQEQQKVRSFDKISGVISQMCNPGIGIQARPLCVLTR
jgi:hypothetical protein